MKLAHSTFRHYEADFRRYERWCQQRGKPCLPASLEMVLAFVTDELHLGFASPTVARRLAAIAHVSARHACSSPTRDPRVRALLRQAS